MIRRGFGLVLLLLALASLRAQEKSLALISYYGGTRVLDGVLSPDEWNDASEFRGAKDWWPAFHPVTDDSDLSMTGYVKHDAHHHFWNYDPKEYAWISDPVMKRNFGPHELKPEMTRAGFQGSVPVQARSSLKETDWLLDLADSHDYIRGVVGWLPVGDPSLPDLLERYASEPMLRGIRTGVELGAQGDRRRRFEDGLRLLGQAGLSFDLLISEGQLGAAIGLLDRLPDLTFVVDHMAKPRIRDHVLSPWRENLREAARRPNVYCKLSGLVNAADYRTWTEQDLRPYVDIALEAFGRRRLMFGSDWPVCLVAASYERWYGTARQVTAALSPDEQAWVFGRAAAVVYRLWQRVVQSEAPEKEVAAGT